MRRKIWAVARLKLLFQIIMLIAVVSLGILANTQYAAAQAIAIVDDGGANDAVGQNDLTRLKLDNGNPALLEIAWSWDEPSAITGGGQAVNACAMFDTDGDGNVNYSLCLEVSEDHDQNSPTFGQLVISKPPPPDGDTWFPHWIECSDAKDDRCTQPNRLGDPVDLPAGLGATTCSAMVAPTDPFDAAFPNGPGSDYPNDIEAACSIDTTLLPATYEFINVCSYPSAANDGNNNPFDCVVTPGSGFLTIVKVASPDNGTQFDFTLDPAASNGETTFSINGSGRIDRIPLLKSLGTGGAGLYSLLEAVPASWQLESVTCVTNGTSTGAASATFPAAGSTSAGQESIEIQPGQETICTFDNSQDALPDISVTKTANPSAVDEPGGDVTFTVLVENKSSSAVTLDSLEDDIYGDLTDISNEGGTAKPQLGTTCAVAQNLAASDGTTGSGPDVYSCTFDATVSGNAGESETDTVTATASNAAAPNGVSATDDATVTVADVASVLNIVKSTATPSLPEPGGTFSYQANITNPASNVDDIIISRVDDTFGGSLTAAECGVAGFPVTLSPGDSMTCQFTVEHTGNLGDSWTNTVSATAIDDDNQDVSAESNPVTVNLTDVPAVLNIVKSTSTPSLPEPGGVFSYQAVVSNPSSNVDDITISDVSDTFASTLTAAQCNEAGFPVILTPGDSMTCTFTVEHTGNLGDTWTNTVSARATDDDGNNVDTLSNQVTVGLTDVSSELSVVKSTATPSLPEPGGTFLYQVVVGSSAANVDDITVNRLDDTYGGTLTAAQCGIAGFPVTLRPGDSMTCHFTVEHRGNRGDRWTNRVFATAINDDGEVVSTESNEVTVNLTDVPSVLHIVKSTTTPSLPEPGGTYTYQAVISSPAANVDDIVISELSDTFASVLTPAQCGLVSLPVTLVPGSSITCQFTVDHLGNLGDTWTNRLAATAVDDDNDDVSTESNQVTVGLTGVASSLAVEKIAEPQSVLEPGGTVGYTITVVNTSAVDTVTLETLEEDDTNDGSVDIVFNAIDVCSEVVLAPAQSTTCTFTRSVSGNPGDTVTDEVVVRGIDDDGNAVSDSATADVAIEDVASSITVSKIAGSIAVPEPGASVAYTVTVRNASSVDTVTLTTLVEDDTNDGIADIVYNAIDVCTDVVLAPAQSTECTFSRTVSGNAGDIVTDKVTVNGTDDDDHTVSGVDTADVTLTNVLSSIQVEKRANPSFLAEPGGAVEFTVDVLNSSTVDTVELSRITDDEDNDGSVDVTYNALVICDETLLLPGESATCRFTRQVSGNAGDIVTDTATVHASDDDGQELTDSDTADVEITDLPSAIQVTKHAQTSEVLEPGEDVRFEVTVANVSAVDTVSIETVSDDVYGDISGSCAVNLPALLPPGDSFTCTFTEFIGGNTGDEHENTVTASGEDDDGAPVSDSDTERVSVDNIPSSVRVTKSAAPGVVSEPGANVQFTVVVENDGDVDTITVDSVTDDTFGDISGFCEVTLPAELAPGERFSCVFTEFIGGNGSGQHLNVVTVRGQDDDGNPVEDSDEEDVDIVDIPTTILVFKSVNRPTVPETGADVDFTVVVQNTSAVDTVTIDSVIDDVFGDLSADCTDPTPLPAEIAPAGKLSCKFSRFVAGDAGDSHRNVVIAEGVDDDGARVRNDDDAEILFTDVPSSITVSKSPDRPSVTLDGANVVFTIAVRNQSRVDIVTLTAFTDNVYGDVADDANPLLLATDCETGTTIAPLGVYQCTFTAPVPGGALGDLHENTVTVDGLDDDLQPVSAEDDARIVTEEAQLTISKMDEPPAGQEVVFPGDTLTYYVTFANVGNAEALDVFFEDTPDADTALVAGTVETSKGTVVSGNVAGDAAIMVEIGSLAAGEVVTITFKVLVDGGIKKESILNQAVASREDLGEPDGREEVESDDPTTVELEDPTGTGVVLDPTALDVTLEPGAPMTGFPENSIFLPLLSR